MFSGTYECKMDPKGRILLPAKLKSMMPNGTDIKIVLQLGFKKCLNILTAQEWAAIQKRFRESGNYNSQKQQLFRDMTFGMEEQTLDAQGRFSLNKFQTDYAGLGSDVLLFGMSNKIEIWNKETFMQTLTPLNDRESLEALAEAFLDQPFTP